MPHAKLPAHGSIVGGDGRFFLVSVPQPPVTRIRLVEMPVHSGPAPSKVLSVDPEKLRLAISRGVLTIVQLQPKVRPRPLPVTAPPTRPYPFEVARDAAAKRRRRLWNRADVVDLRRRGLLMTGAEYERRLEAKRRPAPLGEDRDCDD